MAPLEARNSRGITRLSVRFARLYLMHVAETTRSADVIDLRDDASTGTNFGKQPARSTVLPRATPTDELLPMTEPTPAEQLEELVREHLDAVYRVAFSVVRDSALAEDVAQDAILKAWKALPTFRGESSLRSWLLRITHNTAISTLRKRREVLQDPFEMPEEATQRSVERQAHGRMALEAFEEALGRLDELTRSIVVLREVESLSYDEIAELLDVPLPTVKTRLLRARRQLSASLDGWRA